MFEELQKIIEKHDSIVLFAHANPDGDSFGSQVALKETIKINYPEKNVYIAGSGYHRFISFLGEPDDVSDEVIENSLAILLDGNDLARMEDQRINKAKSFIKIDHHIDSGSFTEGPFVVDTSANSTCELIYRFIREANYKINPNAANALFLGILTDTGRFQFIYDFAFTFEEASWLVKQGADPKAINAILNVNRESTMKFKGYVFSHYKKTEHGVLYLVIPHKILKKMFISASKAASMVNLISNIEGFPVWVFFAENENGSGRVEVRSSGPVIQPVLVKRGGGGHAHAAGVTIPEFNKNYIQPILDELDEIANGAKKEI